MPKKNESDNRCWPGYEPVKGKKKHEQGSCRPKAESKTSPSEKEFRSKRRRQLDKWEAEHPGTRKSASQHLHAPGKKPKTKQASKPAKKKAAAKRRPAKKKTTTRSR
jgi:hypothetical protein